ncbi:MAG: DUF4412 domain-containing protein [Prolixibacteraceae bacterium]|nr:DUF4412 domain-containing protein [Prolixibacteraceae bacterium]
MKKIILLLIAIVLTTSYNNCEAQRLLKNIANKAKNKVEERVSKKIEEKAEERIDEEIDNKLDEAFNENDSTSTNSETTREEKDNERLKNIMGRIGLNSAPVEIEDSYSFTSNVKMQIESYQDDKLESTGFINSFFNDNIDVFAYEFTGEENSEDKKGFFIFDQPNSASIILSEDDGEKKGIATGIDMNQLGAYAETQIDAEGEETDYSLLSKKTGRTKKILGYNCEEYEYTDENTKSIVWITKDKVWKADKLYSSLNLNTAAFLMGYPDGFIMEAESVDLETNEKSIMKITEINENINKEIDLSDYEIMNMGSINIPQQD